jgi:hypothetical protein
VGWVVVAGFVISACDATAGVRRDDYGDIDDSDYISLGSAPDYASIGQVHATYPNYPNDPASASGVLIADRWVLTAGHVVGRLPIVGTPSAVEFAIEGTTYSAVEWFAEPSFFYDYYSDTLYGHDIGLIRLDDSVSTVAFAQRYSGLDEQNAVATIVGFGNAGEGSYGEIQNTFGTKRAGHNVINQFYRTPNRDGGPAFEDNYLVADFDNPSRVSDSTMGDTSPLATEYIVAHGDSGGGLFIDVNDTAYLAGINSFIGRGPGESDSPGNLNSDYGDVQYFTRVSLLNGWIDDHLSSVYWEGESSNSFEVAANWEDGNVPDTNNIAVFNKAGSYTVTMGSDAHNKGLRVSQGNATLDLGGNAYTLSETLAQPSISVGSPTSATLTVSNGSLSAMDAELGAESYGIAGNLIAGAGAILTFSGSVSFRSAGGAAVAMELVVNNGATLYADSVIIPAGSGDRAKLKVDGAATIHSLQIGTSPVDSLPIYLIDGSGDLSITGESDWYTGYMGGSGKTLITESGSLRIHVDGQDVWADPRNFRPIENQGTITTLGAGIFQIGSTLNNKAFALFDVADNAGFRFGILNNEMNGLIRKSGGNGSTTFDQTTINNIGTLQVESGTLLLTGSVPQLSGSTLSGGTWNVLNGSTLSITIGSNITSLGVDATVRLSGATAAFDKISTLHTNNGRFQIDGGKNFSAVGAFSNNGTLSVGSGSTMSAAGTLTNNGRTEGTGTVTANITSHGIISPGQSTGVLTIDGNATLFNDSRIDIELGGITAGTEYDRLLVTGSATLNGVLHLDLINGFSPTVGNSFDIFDWGGPVGGTFTTLDLPLLTGGLAWIMNQLYTTGVLTVGLPGDFNFDGVVDTADYIVWRKIDGTPEGYNTWRANFGRTVSSSASVGDSSDYPARVPEPTSLLLIVLGAMAFSARSRRRYSAAPFPSGF